jgi:hypothetical protein
MIHLGVYQQMSIVEGDSAISRHKRHGPLWVDLVGLYSGYVCEGTWKSPDRWESRACFRPVAVKQVKVDIGTWGLKLRRVQREQNGQREAVAKGEKEDAI